jgi:ribonuclease HII
MAILAGIDEAGFGPILGPLVVSSSVFRVPDNLVWADLWGILKKSVSDKRAGLTGRLLIADSKKAFVRADGVGHLRRTVLAALKYLGREPRNLTELISVLCPDCIEHLREYPWYKKINEYQLGADSASIGIAVSMLARDLANNNIEFLGLSSRCLEVAYYNKMVSAVNNKASVLFTAVAGLIQEAVDKFKKEDLELVIDRQGGRCHYRPKLQLMFEDAALRIIHEDDDRSSYELQNSGRKIRMHFVVGADDKYLPVALASMACKYIREVLIDNLNNYFIGMNSQLKPTAGYWKDGLRFIADIKKHIPNANYDSNQLIRCR